MLRHAWLLSLVALAACPIDRGDDERAPDDSGVDVNVDAGPDAGDLPCHAEPDPSAPEPSGTCDLVDGVCPQGCDSIIGTTFAPDSCCSSLVDLGVCIPNQAAHFAVSCIVRLRDGAVFEVASTPAVTDLRTLPGFGPCAGVASPTSSEACAARDAGP